MKLLAVLGLFGMVALTLPAQNTMTVEGVVVDSVTGVGISGSAVQLFSRERFVNVLVGEYLTNEAGDFRFSGLKPGDYSVSARKQGYSGRAPSEFRVNAGESPTRPRLELIPPAILRGRVLWTDGTPVKATVDLGPGFRRRVSTNEDGYFAFEQLEPGSYTLLGRPEAAQGVSIRGDLRTEVVPTYYPSVLAPTQAVLIIVRPGVELSGYEIRLQSAPVYRVSGIVLDPTGKPAPDAVVQLLDRVVDGFTGFNGGQEVFSVRSSSFAQTSNATQSSTTDEDGVFEFPSVRTGDWTVRVESDAVRDEIRQRDVIVFGSATITVGNQDLEDLRIQLGLPLDVSGTVETGDAPLTVARAVAVTLTGESGYFGGTAHPGVNNALLFEGVIPGRYLISAEAIGNYYASVLMGSRDVTGQTVELNTSSLPTRVVLKPGGKIRWTLEQSSSWAVVLMPQKLDGLCYSVQSGVARTSEMTGIPPGDYYAIALDKFNSRTMADISHLRDLLPKATSVRVEEGSVSYVQLKIDTFPD